MEFYEFIKPEEWINFITGQWQREPTPLPEPAPETGNGCSW